MYANTRGRYALEANEDSENIIQNHLPEIRLLSKVSALLRKAELRNALPPANFVLTKNESHRNLDDHNTRGSLSCAVGIHAPNRASGPHPLTGCQIWTPCIILRSAGQRNNARQHSRIACLTEDEPTNDE